MKHMSKFLPSLIAAFFIAAGQLVFAEPANLSLLRKEVISYYKSGNYENDLNQVINKAQLYIDGRAERAKTTHEKLAIVLDIDETSLSNVKRIIHENFSDNPKVVEAGILAADSPAIKPMLNLYNDAKRQGIAVFFVTGRQEELGKATKTNLLKAGYTDWSGLYLRPNVYTSKSIVDFKAKARADIEKQGFTIIASIGDQQSDINGGFAEKGFKLPNPFYFLP